ncbi:MAG: hypothetical protein U5N55_06940, partial [Cypionkella sp.]|nr:hypothetical protein [Cypionkella sp.]
YTLISVTYCSLIHGGGGGGFGVWGPGWGVAGCCARCARPSRHWATPATRALSQALGLLIPLAALWPVTGRYGTLPPRGLIRGF